MKNAQKPDHVSLSTLISRLKEGRYVVPDFQREFEWKPWDVRDLMRSIFLDYYIGSLLLWKGTPRNFETLSCEPVYGFEGGGSPEHIVLDGQQRLTAMHYAFLAPNVPLPNRAKRAYYYVQVDQFMDEEYDEAFHYAWESRQWAEVMGHTERQYAEHVFPLGVIGSDDDWALPNWVQGYEAYWKERTETAEVSGEAEAAARHAENAKAFGKHLREITGQYQVSYIELADEIGVDKVCDIFTQINSKGVQLDVFDLMNALLKPKGLQLKHMWREAKPKLDFVDTGKMNVYILQVMSILRQAYCSPKYLYFLLPDTEKPVRAPDGTRGKEVLIETTEEFETRWVKAVEALERAVKRLRHPQEFGAIASKYLPYPSILPVFAAVQAYARALPPHQRLGAERKVRHWYWASVFTNRYSGSVESTMARDFLDLKAWFDADDAEPALIQEFAQRYADLDLRSVAKSGSSIYNGVFNLLVLNGAQDWSHGTPPDHEDLDDHHIVPASWGRDHLDGDRIHSILNRTPLTAETNRKVIHDRLPNLYLREMIEHNGEDRVRAILATHLVSPEALSILLRDPFTPDDYNAFIAERQRTIREATENLLVKERLDLAPALRDLDADIERIELRLRSLIEERLDGETAALPGHVVQKSTERVQRASRKNPAMDGSHYESMAGLLEFADLRELQDTIVGKALWPLFEPVFTSKETLIGKLDQLAELRNGIRHSRTVDDVTRKEGEASILWLDRVLGRSASSVQQPSSA